MSEADERAGARAHYQRISKALGQAFRPAVPITHRDLFAGRVGQMNELIDVGSQPGQHAALYGERGVGKTSLASVMVEILRPETCAVRVNCAASDSFARLWRRALEEIQLVTARRAVGFSRTAAEELSSAADLLATDEEIAPDDVRRALAQLAGETPIMVFFDEFDRLITDKLRAEFADTLKTLSDNDVQATVVVVGVADNIDELIAAHRSIERGLVQIPMPRMSTAELEEILYRGLGAADMAIDAEAQRVIVRLSQGLPHYTHLLGLYSGRAALERGDVTVQTPDVSVAIRTAIDKAQESVIESYHQAVASNRAGNLYKQVLLACAMARTDERGFFAAADVREPLSSVMDARYDIPQFAQHLQAFSGDSKKAPVLQKIGSTRRFKYRFINPLLQPYVLMNGVEQGLVKADELR